MANASDNMDRKDDSMLEEHLKCPICFEIFRNPRALSCMHTFCEECLSSHILKSDVYGTVECPTCRQHTRISDSRKPKDQWAKTLPLNYTILPLIEALNKHSKEMGLKQLTEEEAFTECISCLSSINFNATYCMNCAGIICVACAELHKKLKVFTDHEVFNFNDEAKPRMCDKHDSKTLEFYCEHHKKAVCSTCAVSDHRGCDKVSEITGSIIKDTILLKANELTERLSDLTGIVKIAFDNYVVMHDKFLAETSKVTEKYDKFKENIEQRCALQKETVSQSRLFLTKLNNICSLLNACKKSPSKECMFIVLHNVAKEVEKIDKDSEEILTWHIKAWSSNDLIEDFIMKSVESVEFCKLKIVDKDETDKERDSVSPDCKGATAASQSDFQQRKSNIVANSSPSGQVFAKDVKWKFIRSSSLSKGTKGMSPWYIGMVCLKDNCLVAIDNQNNELVLLNSSCVTQDELLLDHNPVGITKVSECCVAVVFDVKKLIQLFFIADVENSSETECLYKVDEIPLNIYPHAVAFSSFGYTVISSGVIINTDDKGEKMQEIVFDISDLNVRKTNSKHILVNEGVGLMYISDQETNTLTVMGYEKEPVSKPYYKVKKVKTPGGLDYDTDNNVYVCCERENCIMVFTRLGDLITEIPVVSCRSPSTIAFNTSRDKFWVTNKDSPEVMKEFIITHYLF